MSRPTRRIDSINALRIAAPMPRSQPERFSRWLKELLRLKLFPLAEFHREAGLSPKDTQRLITDPATSTKGMRRDAYEAAMHLLDRHVPLHCKNPMFTEQRDISVYFTGVDGEHEGQCLGILNDAIAAAKRRVLVMAYCLSAAIVLTAFDRAAQRGVDVRVIYEPRCYRPRKRHPGIRFIPDTVHTSAHNKVIIVDDEVVFTGSFNFTDWADNKNAENLVEIRDPMIVKQYVDHWERSGQTLVSAAKDTKLARRSRTRD
jgi:hypothetical protein